MKNTDIDSAIEKKAKKGGFTFGAPLDETREVTF